MESPPGPPGPDDVTVSRGRRRRGKARAAHTGRTLRVTLASVAVILVSAAGVAAIAAALWVHSVTVGLSIATMPEHLPGVNSTIFDNHGRQLARVASTQNRIPVTASHISPWLVRATIAIEDRRFYDHGGVDYEATVRALWADLTAGAIVQGGSTIEQQLAKLLYLDGAQTVTRKVQEAALANQIADQWSRTRILTTYLNIVPYGGVTYGCEAAARTYFGTHCGRLSLIQAATLAGLPRSPTDYNPRLHPRAARHRRNEVLAAMAANGDISARAAARLSRRPLQVHRAKRPVVRQAYFVQYVEQQLRRRYGTKRLETGGLRISTTLDQRLQRAANQAFASVLGVPGDPAAALVAMDPRTGAVLAFDSTTDPRAVHFDLPSQAHRQAGSAFKPFALLGAMLDDHIDPETTFYSGAAPFTTTLPGCDPVFPSCHWKVNNAEPGGAGTLSLHEALDGSVNAVFARLSIDIGADPTVDMAYRVGIPRRDHLPRVPSIVLGTGLVSPLDMTTAYSTLADGGVYHRPLAVTGVRSIDGRIHVATPPSANRGRRVIPAWAASELNSILHDNITCRLGLCTGGGALLSPPRPQAGKTGTVESHLDAWFCGYMPTLAACVWMGFPKREESMIPAVGTAASFGGGYPATMWRDFATSALAAEPQRFPPLDFAHVPPPAGWYVPWTPRVAP